MANITDIIHHHHAMNSIQIDCDVDNPTDIYILSKTCVNGSDWKEFECIYDLDHQIFSRRALGAWAIIVSFVGVFGNTLMLLSVPFAASRKR